MAWRRHPIYNPAVGYGYGLGLGLATAAVADSYWGGAYYRPYDAGYGCCAATGANVYSHWGDTVAAGTRTWYAGDGVAGTTARGDYANYRTGTTGTYAAGRSYDAWTGTAQRGYGRTFDTAGGTTGAVERGERYNPATGTLTSGSRMSATGPEGGSVSRDTARVEGPWGGSAAAHQTTIDNPRTGESHTVDTARVGGQPLCQCRRQRLSQHRRRLGEPRRRRLAVGGRRHRLGRPGAAGPGPGGGPLQCLLRGRLGRPVRRRRPFRRGGWLR